MSCTITRRNGYSHSSGSVCQTRLGNVHGMYGLIPVGPGQVMFYPGIALRLDDVRCLRAFLPLGRLKLHRLSFLHRFEALDLNR